MTFNILITLAIISIVIAAIAFIGQVVITIFEIIHPESYYLIIHEDDEEDDEKDDYERDDKEDNEKKQVNYLTTNYREFPP